MNQVYRVVWNASKQVWQAVSEIGRRRGKNTTTSIARRGVGAQRMQSPYATTLSATVLATALLLDNAMAAELPTGGNVVAGTGQISQSGTTLTVNQGSSNLVINWNSFSVGAGHTVNFVQPSAQAAAFNRVVGSDVSVIQGAINANGKVFLVNPNGVLFTPGAQVNVGSMVASTLNMSTADFMAGNYRFEGTSSNAIVNQGNITAVGSGTGGGTIALIAAKVTNTGTLTASRGNVLVGAGQKVQLDLGGPVKIEVDSAALNALIEQGGAIKAQGGLVYLTAKAAGELASTAINHTGITEAQTLQTGDKGQIYLLADMQNGRINVGGTLDASAPSGGDGGFIETSAAQVIALQGRKVTAQAARGATGTYLIDPNDYIVAASGGNITGAQLGTDLALSNVTISTALQGTAGGNGDIVVNDEVNWSANLLTLNADRNIDINARLQGTGSAQLALQYGQAAVAAGNTAKINIAASVGLPAGDNYTTLLGSDGTPKTYTVITSLGDPNDINTGAFTLRGMAAAANLSRNFALGANIDASATRTGTAFTPIGKSTAEYNGSFDGLGNEISNLNMAFQADGSGLFGNTSNLASVVNVGLPNAKVSYVAQEQKSVGALVGRNRGVISNSYATGDVRANTFTGGLVGWNSGSIDRSYYSGYVSAGNRIGGLVGVNDGSIANSYATGQAYSSFSQDFIGGLVGQNNGQISSSYARAQVTNYSANTYTGYLTGYNGGSISNSFWDTSSGGTGVTQGIGVGTQTGATGLNASQIKQSASFSGFDFASTWYAQDGNSAPLLRAFLTPLTISAKNATKTYDGQTYTDTNGLAFSGPSTVDRDQILGTPNYGEVSTTAPDASNTPYDLSVSGLYSAQQGYIISYASGGQLTVNPAVITLSASREYNGSNVFAANSFGSSGTIDGILGQTLLLSGNGLASSKNAILTGGSYAQNLDATGLTLSDNPLGTGKASNYTLTGGSHTATITPKTLTISGTTVANKAYDGTTTATATAGTLGGLVGAEALNVDINSAQFDDKNAGTHNVTVAYSLTNGTYGESQTALAANYTLDDTTETATITPKALTMAGTTVADKVYDGTRAATATAGTLSGLVGAETLNVDINNALFDSPNVGNRIATVSYTLTNGTYGESQTALASNYSLADTRHNAKITAPQSANTNVSIPRQTATNVIATVGAFSGPPAGGSSTRPGLSNTVGFNGTLGNGPVGNSSSSSGNTGGAGGLVFVPVGSSPSTQTGLVPIFTVGTGVNFGRPETTQ